MACKLGVLLEPGVLSDDDAGLLSALLAGDTDAEDRDVPAVALSQALRAMGHDVGQTTVKDHRGCRCACTRERTDR